MMNFDLQKLDQCLLICPEEFKQKVLEELSEEMAGKASFYAVDVDDNQDLAVQYGISSIPYVAVFKDGNLVDEQVGFVPKAALKGFVERNL